MRRLSALAIAAVTLLWTVSGCNGSASGDDALTPSAAPPASSESTSPRAADELAGLAAAAKDRHFVAPYEFTRRGVASTVTATLAADGSWRFDVPGGAHGGKRDVTVVRNRQGVFQCVLGATNACVRIASADEDVPGRYDTLVQDPFTTWIDVILSRTAPLSIVTAEPLDDTGRCFSIERNSVTVDAPIPPSTMCFAPDGVITAVDAPWGSLRIAGEPTDGPERAKLPAVVTDAEPLATSPPPKPSPKPSTSPKPSPSAEPRD